MNFDFVKKQVYIIFLLLALPLFAVAQSNVVETPFDKEKYNGWNGNPDSLVLTIIYSYDIDDLYLLDGSQENEVYRMKFDEKGRMIRYAYKHNQESLIHLKIYDKKGNLTKSNIIENGELRYQFILKSADEKMVVFDYAEFASGKICKMSQDFMKYTKLSERHIEHKRGPFLYDLFYDKEGRQIRQDVYREYEAWEGFHKMYTLTFEYNDQDLVVSQTKESGSAPKTVKRFEYNGFDKQGNWQECTIKSNDITDWLFVRYNQKIYYRK